MTMTIRFVFSAVAAMCVAPADAALIERLGGRAYYDDIANLTWLQNADEGRGTVFTNGSPGPWPQSTMTWSNAVAWAASLEIEGISGWQLPRGPFGTAFWGFADPIFLANELGNFRSNVLGISPGSSLNPAAPSTVNSNYFLFQNIQAGYYWSEDERQPGTAWAVNLADGGFTDLDKRNFAFAWAVFDGDVDRNTVAEPGTFFLCCLGLVGLVGSIYRRDRVSVQRTHLPSHG